MGTREVLVRVYGVVGKIGVGKDTAIEGVPFALRVGFSDALKEAARTAFGLNRWQTDTQEGKAEIFPSGPVNMDARLGVLSDLLGLRLEARGKVAENARQLLQYLGSDYVRSIQADYWLRRWEQAIDQLPQRPDLVVFAPDTRFLNEAAMVRKKAGKIIRINRAVGKVSINMADMGAGEADQARITLEKSHDSETEQDQIFADYTLYNNGTIAELQGNMRFICRVCT